MKKLFLLLFSLPYLLTGIAAQNNLRVFLEQSTDDRGILYNHVCVEKAGNPAVRVFRLQGNLESFDVILLSDTSFCYLLETNFHTVYDRFIQDSTESWKLVAFARPKPKLHNVGFMAKPPHEPDICILLGEDKILVKKYDGTERIVKAYTIWDSLEERLNPSYTPD